MVTQEKPFRGGILTGFRDGSNSLRPGSIRASEVITLFQRANIRAIIGWVFNRTWWATNYRIPDSDLNRCVSNKVERQFMTGTESNLELGTLSTIGYRTYSMTSNGRKFWSKETVALILGMSSGAGISSVIQSLVGITDTVPRIVISILCMYISLTLVERTIVPNKNNQKT